MSFKRQFSLLACLIGALALPGPAVAEEVLVRYEPGVAPAEKAELRGEGELLERFDLVPRLELVEVPEGQERSEFLQELRSDPAVSYAVSDVVRQPARLPSDPFFSSQWSLRNRGQNIFAPNPFPLLSGADTRAELAWDMSTGSDSVAVAVIDTGVDIRHEDLKDNLWTNPDEKPGNGIDDDQNGKIDDVHGWDFVDNEANPAGVDGHGTHVAGIIGAQAGNKAGTSGVSWDVALASLRVCGPKGCRLSDTIAALQYAVSEGIRVSNNSYGATGATPAEEDAIRAAGKAGHLFVASAGNAGADNDDPAKAFYPASYPADNIISVASSDGLDGLSTFSNYGAESVDLAAPGEAILSTWSGTSQGQWNYAWADGTSMAAPLVSGAAALLLARRPNISVGSAVRTLLDTRRPADPAVWKGKTSTAGILDIARAVSVTPLVPRIVSGPGEQTESSSAAFSWRGEGTLAFECALDGGPWVSCSSPRSFSGLAAGNHTFDVRQLDPLGKVSAPARYSWLVRPGAPVIVSGPASPIASNRASFVLAPSPAGVSIQCRLNSAEWQVCPAPVLFAGLLDGTYVFEARQLSSEGVAGPAARWSWRVDRSGPRVSSVIWRKGSARAVASDPSGLSRIAFSASRRTPASSSLPVGRAYTKSGVAVAVLAAPRWARLRDRLGNWSAWTPVQVRP